MSNPEHLVKRKQGRAAWNEWRAENPLLEPDLSGADLRGAVFLGANLHGANLRGSDLRLAFLKGADLRGADLRFAILHGTDLRETDLREATFGYTSFGLTWLKHAIGLESCQHVAKSYLDYFTLAKSGPFPLTFLRGCGLPDEYIDHLPSLLNQASQFQSCFISYSSMDMDLAQRVYGDLQNKNVRCWYAPEDLKIGDRFQDRIEDSIRLHDKLLLVLSRNSVDSAWVEREVQAAREREDREGKLVLFPIRLDDAVMDTTKAWAAALRRTRHIGDFTRWKDHDSYQRAFERLLRDLKAGR